MKLFIPTRNRPTSLSAVLAFLARFYPGTEVIVADGSSNAFKPSVAEAARSQSALDVDYRTYDYDLPFFDRILDVLRGLNDDLVIMGSDDDFPLIDALIGGARFLDAHPEYVTALGATVHFKLEEGPKLTARLGLGRPIRGRTAQQRAQAFAHWSFSTTYAVSRRAMLIERYERARELFLAGFFDFAVGLHDCTSGGIHGIPDVTFLATRNHNHSYLRAEAELVFLRRADDVLTLIEQFACDLSKVDRIPDVEAREVAAGLFKKRIAELCGYPPHKRTDFYSSRWYGDEVAQTQIKLFEEMFRADTPARQQFDERIRFVNDAMRANVESNDNKGERKFYETLESQAGSSTA